MFTAEIEQLVELTDTELHEHLRSIELERRAVDARFAAAVAVANTRQLNAVVDGHLSMRSYLRAELNYSTALANRWLQNAALVDAQPAIGEAWLEGRIGEAQATTFAAVHANRRVRDRLGEFVPVLLDTAEQMSWSAFAKCVNRFVLLADPDGAHNDRDDAVVHRRGSVNEVAGTLDISVFGGDVLTATEIVKIHRRFVDIEYQKDVAARRDAYGDDADLHDLARTNAQRGFDALIEIFRLANTATVAAIPMDFVVNLIVDDTTFARILHDNGLASDEVVTLFDDPQTTIPHPDRHSDIRTRDRTGTDSFDTRIGDLLGAPDDLRKRRCETATGTPVHPHDLLRATLAGHIRRVVVDTNEVVVNMGRKTRLFTGSPRVAAKLLVTHSQRPGCELAADYCNIDHNHEWCEHGTTDQDNAAVLCGADNRQKHRQHWKHRRSTSGQLYLIRPDGTIIQPVGARPPTFPHESGEGDESYVGPFGIERVPGTG